MYMGAWMIDFALVLFKNDLAQKLFVGRVLAYFHIHMFWLKNPLTYLKFLAHTASKKELDLFCFFVFFSIIIDHAYVSKHVFM